MFDWRRLIRPGKATDTHLGCPAGNIDFRLNHFSEMTGGKGFRQPAKTSNGKRAERKAAARALMLQRAGQPQPAKYRNSRSRRS